MLERQHLESHISKDCLFIVVDCDFQHVGCEVRLPRRDMPAHLSESVVSHLSLQASKVKEVVGNVKRLEDENNELRKQVVKLTEHLKICTLICPVEFTLTEFMKQKKKDAEWRSQPFYNDLRGYKLCLVVYPNGYGYFRNKWVSINIVLMKGEFDDQLKWPFTGRVCVQLLNQDQDKGHKVITITFSQDAVTQGEESMNRHSYIKLQPHSQLRPRYLQNECLKFHILSLGT